MLDTTTINSTSQLVRNRFARVDYISRSEIDSQTKTSRDLQLIEMSVYRDNMSFDLEHRYENDSKDIRDRSQALVL
jgi:hypothetical protein